MRGKIKISCPLTGQVKVKGSEFFLVMIGRKAIKEKIDGGRFLLPAFISGVLLIGAFPPLEQGYLAWFALLPFFISLLNLNPKRAFLSGIAFGLPLHLYLNLYLANVLFPYLPTALALVAMAAMVVYISLFHGLFALAASYVLRLDRGWFSALALPSAWVLVEYLRSVGFMGYNVGYIGYSQWGYSFLLNISSLYGYWGLAFLIVLFQAIIALAVKEKLYSKELYLVSAVFVVFFFAGLFLPGLAGIEGQENGEKLQLRAALIQGNIRPDIVVDEGRESVLGTYLELSRKALQENPGLDLVVWPETVVSLDFNRGREHPPELRELATEYGVSFLYGARLREEGNLYNAIVKLEDGVDEVRAYHKHRLVPFVEFFPLEELLNRLLQLDLLLGSYSEGEDLTLFELDGIPLAGVVCFESYFGDHTRLFAAMGARHIFVLTNDAWFGESIGLELHAQAAAIRAAEAGVGVTQVANSGITISFDHFGQELFRGGKNEADIFIVELDLAKRATAYTRYGDFLPAAAALFLLIAVTFIFLSNRHRSN